MSLNFGFGAALPPVADVVAVEFEFVDGGGGGGLAALFAGVGGLTTGAGLDLAEFDAEAECLNECAAFTGGVPVALGGFGDGLGVCEAILRS